MIHLHAQRIAMTSVDEYDAFTRWRHYLHWHRGERKRIKRKYHRRWRKQVRRQLHGVQL